MSIQEENEQVSLDQKRTNRKTFRFSDEEMSDLDQIKRVTRVQSETEATAFAYHFTARHLPKLAGVPTLTSDTLHDIAGVVGVLCAFFAEAECAMREQGAETAAIQTFGTEVLLHIADPIYLAAVLTEQIGDRPVWLRHSWKSHFQYVQAVDLLEHYLFNLHSRYPLRNTTDREDDEDLGGDGATEMEGESDPLEDEDEPSIRLFPGDIYALYDETLMHLEPDEESSFIHGLRQSLATFIPHLGKEDRKRQRSSQSER